MNLSSKKHARTNRVSLRKYTVILVGYNGASILENTIKSRGEGNENGICYLSESTSAIGVEREGS